MDRSLATQLRHRLVCYALLAALSFGLTIAPSVSEAGSPEERREAVSKPDPTIHDHQGTMLRWLTVPSERTNAEPAFQGWLSDIYIKLVGLKAAITSALPRAWKWGHDKSGGACR